MAKIRDQIVGEAAATELPAVIKVAWPGIPALPGTERWYRSSGVKVAAMSWSDRLSRVSIPDEQIIEGVARAIYATHWRPPAPEWQQASDTIRNWVRAQAHEALLYLRTLTRPAK